MTIDEQPIQEADLDCPECGAKMALRSSKFRNGFFYGCSRFPACRATHGAHPNGRPLGIPGDRKTKDARIAAHEVFDRLWKSGLMTRKEAYAWLARKMRVSEFHFGEAGVADCERALRFCERKLKVGV